MASSILIFLFLCFLFIFSGGSRVKNLVGLHVKSCIESCEFVALNSAQLTRCLFITYNFHHILLDLIYNFFYQHYAKLENIFLRFERAAVDPLLSTPTTDLNCTRWNYIFTLKCSVNYTLFTLEPLMH